MDDDGSWAVYAFGKRAHQHGSRRSPGGLEYARARGDLARDRKRRVLSVIGRDAAVEGDLIGASFASGRQAAQAPWRARLDGCRAPS